DTLVARVDLKADRVAGALIVKRCTWERDAPANARAALDRQLRLMADWLELDGVIA
ncbi:winged helix-turn-helix domain-containing protein, partial [Kocuria subflava]|nr:winged helix-turn-helix domain-containing protein [Kocuria subflava]